MVGPEAADQRLEERQAAISVEVLIVIEHLARHRGAGRFAAAGQQRLAQFDQAVGVRLLVGGTRAAEQDAAALGNRCKQVGKKGVGHGGCVESV